jgi:hypothetical protein
MTNKTPTKRARKTEAPPKAATSPVTKRVTRSDTLLDLMRTEGGATAQALAEAVGWQVHSVRGFISGNMKKRTDLVVTVIKADGVTRYHVADTGAAEQA